ncbi:uncharacterized protein LOC126740416 isoform X2 [Anthonomus grandis grandis]|uniref:uncharacterized protein LOC126740416 isoform X2 n=1 Tax=Anthonomus grandis grandis TaxID=2921223 RepID=UPI0021655E6A|nr:uncharacterized protein LOC126740416 isoform X2 [Anthonomus grandis grandis]
MPQWININDRLRQGISLINNLDTSTYSMLLTRETLTEPDLIRLQTDLNLKEDQLQLLLQSIAYIYKQSSRVVLKPATLLSDLVEILGLDAGKAELFVKKWSEKFSEEVGDFEERHKLDGLSWELNVQVGSDMESKKFVPEVRIQLELSKFRFIGE